MSTSLCIDTQDWLGVDCISIGDTGGGVLGSSIPSTGDAGSAYAYPMLVHPGDDGKEICGRITSIPVGLTLYAFEDTASIASANDGTYTMYYQPYLDYVPYGSPLPVSYTFGSGNASAPGAALTATSSIAGGVATGGAAGTAPGATLTATSSITGGVATGQINATAAGVVLTATTSITGGAATGNAEGVAPGATLTATASITGGGASSNSYAHAPAGDGYRPRRQSRQSRPRAIQGYKR